MPNFPGGGYTVLFVCGLGFAVVAVFALREFRFSFHQRRGIKLFNEKSYEAALRHLIRAERLWMLRVSKQTMSSHAEDCRNLGNLLEVISEAAQECSQKIETAEYRKAAGAMEGFFSNEKMLSKDYSRVYSTFEKLRKKFRLDTRNIPV
jgi:hypothetical protein